MEVDETGQSYAENAVLKARAFYRASHMATLADDSGLEVDALGGLPGLRSARFSPLPNASDADRRNYLLSFLREKPRPWKAHFHCTIALVFPNGEPQIAEGECNGEIIPEERGNNGFGYDPIFLLPEMGCTMAELTDQQKNQLSHRARALQAARPLIERWLRV
jgi:XTP/dITP diphosphohydrolase